MLHTLLKRSLAVLSVVLLVVVSHACGGSGDGDPAGPPDDTMLPNEVDATGGTVQLANGVVGLVFPAGAVSSTILVTATATTGPASTLVVGGAVYDLGPDGTQFATPVTLTLTIDPAALPGSVQAGELRLHKVVGGVWEEVAGSTANATANTVSGQISSFSIFGALGLAVETVTVSPATSNLDVGGSVQLSTTIESSTGVTLQRTVNWSSSDESVATVDAAGNVTGEGEGEATITATVDGVSATATVTVTVPVASVDVTPAESALSPGQTAQLTATPRAADGSALERPVTWSSSDEAVATVDGDGLVTVQGVGTATITAMSGGVSGTAEITVTDAVAIVVVTDPVLGLIQGTTHQLGVTATTAGGSDVPNPAATWSSSDETVATVDANGLVTGVAPGQVTITVTVDGVAGTADMTITVDWTSLAGTWVGTWVNTTFGSTDALRWVFTVDVDNLTMTLVVDMDGPVFGLSDPAPLEAEGTLGATTFAVSVNAPLHGPVTFDGSPTDITFQSTNVPAVGIDAWTSTGSIANGQYAGTFTIAFTGGGTAQGTAQLTKQ